MDYPRYEVTIHAIDTYNGQTALDSIFTHQEIMFSNPLDTAWPEGDGAESIQYDPLYGFEQYQFEGDTRSGEGTGKMSVTISVSN